jgi:hypothetical protein
MVEVRVLVLTLIGTVFGLAIIGYLGFLGHTVHTVCDADHIRD